MNGRSCMVVPPLVVMNKRSQAGVLSLSHELQETRRANALEVATHQRVLHVQVIQE